MSTRLILTLGALLAAMTAAGIALSDHDREGREDEREGHGESRGWLPEGGDLAPVTNATYREQCGGCHLAYPPGLLPADGWRRVMGELANHYGDDASLDAAASTEVVAYLTANGADGNSRIRSRAFAAAPPSRERYRRASPRPPTSSASTTRSPCAWCATTRGSAASAAARPATAGPSRAASTRTRCGSPAWAAGTTKARRPAPLKPTPSPLRGKAGMGVRPGSQLGGTRRAFDAPPNLPPARGEGLGLTARQPPQTRPFPLEGEGRDGGETPRLASAPGEPRPPPNLPPARGGSCGRPATARTLPGQGEGWGGGRRVGPWAESSRTTGSDPPPNLPLPGGRD